MSSWAEGLWSTQGTVERLYIMAGIGTPCYPTGRAAEREVCATLLGAAVSTT